MRLLIITQRLDENDDNLGFFLDWIAGFAKQAEKVVVIAQAVGSYELPKNVEVFSLGKEKRYSKIRQLFNFYGLLFSAMSGSASGGKKLPEIDAVFVHMIPLWVVLGAPIYKIFRKKVYLWYVHKSVNFTLKLAEKVVKNIFTASSKSCRLKSKKIIVTGHGINMEKFKIPASPAGGQNSKFTILTAGRITQSKNLDILIKAAGILKEKYFSFRVKIAGAPILSKDKHYFEELKNAVKEKGLENEIEFIGTISHKNIAGFYREGNLFVNFSDTGSIDKAMLEAMASGLLVLTCNEAFKNILPERYFTQKNPADIAEKIILLSQSRADPDLRRYVAEHHGLEELIKRIFSLMKHD